MRMTLVLVEKSDNIQKYGIEYVDFTVVGEDVASVMERIHMLAFKELMSRKLSEMWDWEANTYRMFTKNHLTTVGNIASLGQGQVNRLMVCGDVVRKEVYEAFFVHHLRLKHWIPRKMNYRF